VLLRSPRGPPQFPLGRFAKRGLHIAEKRKPKGPLSVVVFILWPRLDIRAIVLRVNRQVEPARVEILHIGKQCKDARPACLADLCQLRSGNAAFVARLIIGRVPLEKAPLLAGQQREG
jgi:hypothetical protein